MGKYTIKLDRNVLKLLGTQLYGDVPSVIAELVANSYDAEAHNVWITINTKGSSIIIEDDGNGMTEEEINSRFLNIGYDKRETISVTSHRKMMGRKGIGKLAAFSLTNCVKVLSCKKGKKAGCILDFIKITTDGGEPEDIPIEEIIFSNKHLSEMGSGTRLELLNIKKRITTSYRYIVNRLIRMFDVNDKEFLIHIRKNKEKFKTLHRDALDYFSIMDTIVVIGDEFLEKKSIVDNNKIVKNLKLTYTYDDVVSLNQKNRRHKLLSFPYELEVEDKSRKQVIREFSITGWIGTVSNLPELNEINKKLVVSNKSEDEEINRISVNDNRISIFSRNKLGEYDILPKIKTNTNREAYVIGELYADIFEDDDLVDMAISNRRGYEEQDSRYIEVIKIAKSLLNFVVKKRTNYPQEKYK
ncbi:MAG TPA: hypothetical protein DCW90_13935 [Lachnospiraceae bacterium]|nr:ATP-binding protein [uncultured Lachnoclostridium sp.]HAU86543.1 hypothetical protein [Lachnospiraceae bacterium]